jgi:hypothetical protein
MEQHLLDEQETQPATKRPVFLALLCVHTWIGSALYFWFFVKQCMIHGTSGSIQWEFWNALISSICAVTCAVASIVMWKQRKWGFYLYLTGEATPLLIGAWLLFSRAGMDLLSLTILFALWIIPIGFIMMYALNLKYMRR